MPVNYEPRRLITIYFPKFHASVIVLMNHFSPRVTKITRFKSEWSKNRESDVYIEPHGRLDFSETFFHVQTKKIPGILTLVNVWPRNLLSK